MNRVIFWDFHGTLAYRPKLFGSSMKMVLDEYETGNNATDESFVEWLRRGFPWDEPDKCYKHLLDTEVWWNNLYGVFEKAYVNYGIEPVKAAKYARETRKYITGSQYYTLFEDTLDTLRYFKDHGYRNIILSNHIPELPQFAEDLGLMKVVDLCITSAKVGYEKPNPEIFKYALKLAGNPQNAWMVGDNVYADVRGAEAVGLYAVLVRRPVSEPVKYFSPDLKGTIELIR